MLRKLLTTLAPVPRPVVRFNGMSDPELFDAIRDGDAEAVRALLPGYPINSQHGTYRASALYKAMSAMSGVSVRIIDLLLDAGADSSFLAKGSPETLAVLARCAGHN